jgi:solute carrier family 35 protein E1
MPKLLLLASLAVGASALAISTAARQVAVPQRMARVVLPTVARPAAVRAMPAVMMAAAAEDPGSEKADPIFETLKTTSFFALWYLFNIAYNIYNKKALNALPMPWTMALLQLFVGIPYVSVLWLTGLRKAPKCSVDNIKTLIPVSLGHLGTHIGAVISLGAGAVSFTHIVKASEPVVSAALSFVILGAVSSWQTYLTLLPIVGGVALASLKELSFTWVGFIAAMVSNLSSALRGILAKKTMGGGVGENMTEVNLYAVLTILSFFFLLPISLMVEPPAAIAAAWATATSSGLTPGYLTKMSLLAGAFYYLYNEVAFLALGRVNPVTHAVGNTIKRVVIIIASVIAFKTPISTLGIIGSSIAIVGTLLYSLAKTKFG